MWQNPGFVIIIFSTTLPDFLIKINALTYIIAGPWLKGILWVSYVTSLTVHMHIQSTHTWLYILNHCFRPLHITVTDLSFVGGNVWPSLRDVFRQEVPEVCYKARRAGCRRWLVIA